MQKSVLNLELLREAQAGNRRCMEKLARLVQGRVYAYLYRMTLNRELAEELTQQIQLRLWHSLKEESFDFEHVNQFLAWLYRSAKGELHHHYRRHQALPMDKVDPEVEIERLSHCQDGLEHSMRLELAESIVAALNSLTLDRRHLLTLRIFEKLSYVEIGLFLGCSELKARVDFHRAKKELQKQLRQRGYGKVFLLPALVLFDRLTHPEPTQAAVVSSSITATTVHIGPAALMASVVGSIPGVWLTSLFSVTLLTLGLGLWRAMTAYPARSEVYNIYSEMEGYTLDPVTGRKITIRSWNTYPAGIEGPCLYKKAEFDFDSGELLRAWIQNRQGNLVHDATNHRVTLVNSINHDHGTIRYYPSDTAAFFAHDLVPSYLTFRFDRWSGLLMDIEDRSGNILSSPHSHIQYNQPFTEAIYEINDVPGRLIHDERDIYHQRGQLDLRVEGMIHGQDVTGLIHMALNYEQYLSDPPWLDIQWGSKVRLIDGSQGAFLYDGQRNLLAAYPAYSFFRGLGRPWHDLNGYNSLIRDAIFLDYKITQQKPPQGYRTQFQRKETLESPQTRSRKQQQDDILMINISLGRRFSHWLTYTIDTYHDQIDRIEIKRSAPGLQIQTVGRLQFSILDSLPLEDRIPVPATPTVNSSDIELYQDFWLLSLTTD